jgi:peroxiredoxin family protein
LREKDAVRVYACSAWVRLLGLDPARVAERVDAVVGLNAFLSQAEGGPMLSF